MPKTDDSQRTFTLTRKQRDLLNHLAILNGDTFNGRRYADRQGSIDRSYCYKAIKLLIKKGLLRSTGPYSYEITILGRSTLRREADQAKGARKPTTSGICPRTMSSISATS
jgi:hypothetical protein